MCSWMCKCGSDETEVIDTRKRDNVIYRRRKCKECGRRWATYEVLGSQVKEGVINDMQHGLL